MAFFTSFWGKVVKLYHVIHSFVVFYLFLILFAGPILFFLLYRSVLSIIFWLYYKGRYKLMEPRDSTMVIDSPASVLTINFFMYIQGPCDISEMRRRFENTIVNFKTEGGCRPWEKMLCAAVRKWGFMCWENKRESFDITQHIRTCPGAGDPNKVYTEADFFSAVAHVTHDMWPEDQPRWNILVVPRMIRDGGEEAGEYSGLCFRMHHAYADGISMSQISRLVLFDKPEVPLFLDPVNPLLPTVPWYVKMYWWIQVFFLGPYSSLRLVSKKENHVFYDGPLHGPKYFGRSSMPFPMSMIRNIRKTLDCSGSSIQHSALLGAMQALAAKKELPIPPEVIGGVPFAILPYPHVYPQNSFHFGLENFPMGIPHPLKRLTAVDHVYRNLASCMYDKMTSHLTLCILGLFPVAVVMKTVGAMRCSYTLSNVLGIKEVGRFTGNTITNFFGTGPLMNGIKIAVGVGLYDNKFAFGFQFEHSSVIECRQDVDEFIRLFEKEIQYLDAVCSVSP